MYDGYSLKAFDQETINGDGTTVVDIEYRQLVRKALDVNGLHYFPVVTEFKGVKFYDADGNEIPAPASGYEMRDLVNAHYYLGDVSFTAVRSLAVSYNSVYGSDSDAGAKNVLPAWSDANLQTDEKVEKLLDSPPTSQLLPVPTINNIELTNIWNAYGTSFGGLRGSF